MFNYILFAYKIIIIMNKTAFKIKKRRNELQYSQEYMASKLGISQPAYANLENGETKITTKRLEKIAKILEIELIDLLDSNTTVNNINNNAKNTYGIVENLYQANKEFVDIIIKQYEKDKEFLISENKKLLKIIENLSLKS